MPPTKNELEKDFENFLNFCEKQNFTPSEFREICKPLASAWRWRFWKRVFLVVCAVALIWWLCSNVEVIAWTSSAVGRLLLIELLPIWNWAPLYNAKCLVYRNSPGEKASTSATTTTGLGRYDTDKANCVLCEKFELVPTLRNVTYSSIEQAYLERGLPVIISDSHPVQSLRGVLDGMLTSQDDFLNSDPCDVDTNLLLKKFFTIGATLDKIVESTLDDEWFLQFRNCQFRAVKASRKFIRRPYYYPLHFEPFYSSWVLMSNNYRGTEKELYLQGLVLVQQLSGQIGVHLMPKTPCEKVCLEVELVLKAGECLVFSTDLWIFYYQPVGDFESVTTIMEIDWRY